MMQKTKPCVICAQPLTASRIGSGFQFCNSPACEAAFRQHLLDNFPCCGACGRPLQGSGQRSGEVRLCGRRECQVRAAKYRTPTTTVCQVCGILLAPQLSHTLPTLCPSPFCQRWQATHTRLETPSEKLLERERRRQALAALALKESFQSRPELHRSQSLEVAVLPYCEATLVPPSKERMRRVEALLLEIASQTQASNLADISSSDGTPEPEQKKEESQSNASATDLRKVELDRLLGRACGTCGGQCCRPGADTGFLNVSKFRELSLKQPGVSPREIAFDYIRRIPSETVADSCIFHGREGCVLTREQRTVTCNTYMCSSLQQLRDDVNQGMTDFMLVATNLRDEDEIRIYRSDYAPSTHGGCRTLE